MVLLSAQGMPVARIAEVALTSEDRRPAAIGTRTAARRSSPSESGDIL
jgi:hypothetical protein